MDAALGELISRPFILRSSARIASGTSCSYQAEWEQSTSDREVMRAKWEQKSRRRRQRPPLPPDTWSDETDRGRSVRELSRPAYF
jgi:hypothetical protein